MKTNNLYPWQHDSWQRWDGLRQRLPHAILLKGAQGTGKFDFAMNVARSLLCEQPVAEGWACQSCSSCRWMGQETHPDFRLLQPDALAEIEVDEERETTKKKPSRQISVDQVRALADFVNLSSHQGGHRVVLIHPAEAMNTNAANALLKTLEEPSAGVLIILVTHKPQQLLPTILSRCMQLAIPLPALETSTAWLKLQGISNPTAMLTQSGFAPLQALRLADEAVGAEEFQHFIQEIKQPARFDVFALADRLQKSEPGRVIHWLQQWCYDLSSVRLAGGVRYHPELADSIRNLAEKINLLGLMRYQKELLVARREASHPLNPKLQLEAILLAYRQMMLTPN